MLPRERAYMLRALAAKLDRDFDLAIERGDEKTADELFDRAIALREEANAVQFNTAGATSGRMQGRHPNIVNKPTSK